MSTARLLTAGVAALLLLTRVYLSTTIATPPGQQPVADLDNPPALAALKAEFNREAGRMRVIILLSPSCPYCLKGASTISRILESHPDHALAIFVVWQPILTTDWGRPETAALHRLPDPRVRQFWDDGHRIAGLLERSSRGLDRQPACCVQNGVWWDLMAVFPPGAEWTDTLPEPVLLDGTVEDAGPAFDALLRE